MAILFQILKHRLDKKKRALYIYILKLFENATKEKKKVVCFVKILTNKRFVKIYILKKN